MKIIKVIDTRQYEEGPDDKWYPIPGSGESNVCARCDKTHEVHFYVEVDPGYKTIEIVGGGCAKQVGLISETQHKSLGSAAITLAKNQSELARLLERKKLQEEIWSKVNSLPVPEIIKGAWEPSKYAHEGSTRNDSIWKMEDADVQVIQIFRDNPEMEAWSLSENIRREKDQEKHLIAKWKLNRFSELAPAGFKQVEDYMIRDVEMRIKRAEKKIKKLMEE